MENFEKTVKKVVLLVFIAGVAGLTYIIFRATGGSPVPVIIGIAIAVFLRRKIDHVDDEMPVAIEDENARKERRKAALKRVFDLIFPVLMILIFLSSSNGGRKLLKRLIYEIQKNAREHVREVEEPAPLIQKAPDKVINSH